MTARAGRYRIDSLLGGGGMGAVYRAIDHATGREVALKRLLAQDGRTRERAELRFRREFHTLASLRHPRIIRAFDYGVDAEGPYYTMELLGGEDLRDVLKARGPLGDGATCLVLRDICSALASLHARGLIHRDLSPRNVRIVDGRAVLFDFGVLVNAGWVGDVAGTVSFVAPEMVRGMPIDGRADLYSLGVLAYVMLTGMRPFAAKDMADLERAWREPLLPPSSLAEVPAALEDVVLDLLRLEPLGRPPSAAVLIDRLTSVGGLEPDPELAVDPGYVSSAAMVGREGEIETITALLGAARAGDPAAFHLEAESGAGKSRLLQEVAIGAKLDGMLVLRVSCEQAEGGPFAAVAALIDEAFDEAAESAERAAAPDAGELARVFPVVRRRVRGAQADAEGEAREPAEERMRVQQAVMRFFRALAEERGTLLLVDDVQRCDEASAAAIAGLVHARVRGLCVGTALRRGEPVRAPTAIAALDAAPARIRLAGLSAPGIEALLRSIFGDVANLSRLARWMADATGGSPLLCTELARHLVETGVVRYAQGTWIVPDDVAARAPVDGLAQLMARRIAALPDDARRVGEVLAVAGGEHDLSRAIALAGAAGVSATGDLPAMVFGALGALAQQGVLVDLGDRFRIRHDSLREALLASLDGDRRRTLHRHVGEVLLAAGAEADASLEAEIGWHLHRGGDPRGASMLERAGRRLFEAQALADCLAPLEVALEVRTARGGPDAVRAEIAAMLVAAGWVSGREIGLRHAGTAIDLCGDLGGIALADRLRRAVGTPIAFLIGVAWAGARWLVRRGEARGPTPIRAITLFAHSILFASAIAYSANQKAIVERFAARAEIFRAFRGHPPFAAYLTLRAMTDILDGRLRSALGRLEEARRLAVRPWGNPMPPAERRQADAATRSMKALVQVNQFDPQLAEDLARIDEVGLEYYRLAAQTARIVHHRYRGEEEAARRLERATEATALQLGSWSTDLQRLLFAHPAYALCHDVEGLKRSLDALERLTAEGMDFGARVAITRAEIARERGEHDEAIALLEREMGSLAPEDHLMRQYGASALAQTALEACRWELAAEWAARGLAAGEDEAVRVLLPWLRCQRVLGLAEDALGRGEDGARRVEGALALAESLDCPVPAGELHEARARIAYAAGDRVRFEHHRARCADWLRPTGNPGLVAVVERLGELARDDASAASPGARGRRSGQPPDATSAARVRERRAGVSGSFDAVGSSPSSSQANDPSLDAPTVATSPSDRRDRGE